MLRWCADADHSWRASVSILLLHVEEANAPDGKKDDAKFERLRHKLLPSGETVIGGTKSSQSIGVKAKHFPTGL